MPAVWKTNPLNCSISVASCINVANNKIGSGGLGFLVDALRKAPTIKISLFLGWNKIGIEGTVILGELIRSKHIERLSIENCSIELEGISHIASAVATSPSTIQLLNVSNNRLWNAGVRVLAPVLSRITRLHIESNDITPAGTKYFPNLSSLLTLNLYGNSIGDKGAQEVAGRVKPGLRKLMLEKCTIGDDGAVFVSHAVAKCRSIQLVSLSKLGSTRRPQRNHRRRNQVHRRNTK